MLVAKVGHRKAATMDALDTIVRESERGLLATEGVDIRRPLGNCSEDLGGVQG
jgi:hypothetical protein